METTMEKKKITQRTLNTKEKLAGVSFMKEVVVKINLYLTRAIQTANEENQVTREEFWDHLFCPSYAEDSETDKKKKYYILDTKKLDRKKCPENPYQKLDFQGSNKYLLYGTRRELPSADGQGPLCAGQSELLQKVQPAVYIFRDQAQEKRTQREIPQDTLGLHYFPQ